MKTEETLIESIRPTGISSGHGEPVPQGDFLRGVEPHAALILGNSSGCKSPSTSPGRTGGLVQYFLRYFVSVCLLPLLLTACATTTEYGHKISGWIGHSVDELSSMLGKPSSTEPQADGGKIVSYERTQTVPAAPVAGTANATTASSATQPATNATTEPANTRTVSCTTRYKADNTGVIRSWTFDGEGCKAHEASVPQQP